ncbi:MAG: sodium:solute symporter family protein [Candidatus Zixiibacteriota bacterium]
MHLIDYIIIAAYLAVQMGIGIVKRIRHDSSAADLIIGGRMLTLPSFVASLVSTYYGGILGVGEYSYRYGLSNWLVLGVPYYVAAALFALFLAKKARQSELLTIPDKLATVYDNRVAVAGGAVIFFMAVPAAYILMIGSIFRLLFGWPFWLGVIAGTLFSTVYVYLGGFRALVRNDLFQFALMYLGFIVLFVYLAMTYGGFEFLQERLPQTHLTWHGGKSGWYIASWYVVALSTLIEPAFFQRCYAARTPSVAKRGILISIACWAVFDFLTTSCGLYARAILPDLPDPVASYPALALQILPPGLAGLLAVAMLVTVMSTVDSYSFIAASTFSNDIVRRVTRGAEQKIMWYTRWGLVISTVLALVMALFFRSVIDIWYAYGSIATPALLIPVLTSFVGKRKLTSDWAIVTMVSSGGLSLIWYLSQYWTVSGGHWLGLEPIFPGLIVSLVIFGLASRRVAPGLP